MDVVARCVRGLEWVVAAEASGRLAASVQRVGHRQVWLRAALPPASWCTLRTVDDVFLRAGVGRGVGHTRAELRGLSRATARVDWPRTAAEAGRPAGCFEVVASFLGKRNYNRFEVEGAVGDQIAARTGWRRLQRGPGRAVPADAPLAVRVHIEGDEAVLGIRLANRPLHRRAWKTVDVPGTLHPPVAAAMGLVAGLRPGLVVADPFCGAGTVGIEIALEEPAARTVASDLAGDAVRTARRNVSVAGVSDRLLVARAEGARPPLPASSVDRLVANTPWGRAVTPAGLLRGGWAPFAAATAAVLGDRGRAVLLVGTGEAAAVAAAAGEAGCIVLDGLPLAVSGAWATMVVLATRPGAEVIDAGGRFGPELAAALAAHGRSGPSL